MESVIMATIDQPVNEQTQRGASYQLLAHIDAIDAVLSRSLEKPRYGRGFIDFARRSVGNGRIVYELTQQELGAIGEIELRPESQAATWLRFSATKDPGTRAYTAEELESIRKEREGKNRLILELDRTRKNDGKTLLEKRNRHYLMLIEWLETSLYQELGHVLIPAHQQAQAGAGAGENGQGGDWLTGGLNLQTKKAGRKPDKENELAYQMVLEGDHKGAFMFWCKAKNIPEPKTADRKNFKQSMQRAEARARRA
jgi:hypothetical protein